MLVNQSSPEKPPPASFPNLHPIQCRYFNPGRLGFEETIIMCIWVSAPTYLNMIVGMKLVSKCHVLHCNKDAWRKVIKISLQISSEICRRERTSMNATKLCH